MTPDSPVSLWPDPQALGTLADLYELTMMAGYHAEGMAGRRATFELFYRRLPPRRSYLVAAGLEQAISDLLNLRFSDAQIEALRALPVFGAVDPDWFDRLRGLRFRGDVWAVPEGTVVFPGEPLVRVEATIEEAQWIETYLIAAIAYPTMVASKASRIVEVAGGRSLVEFGARRGHGPAAGLMAARAAYLAGFDGTSHVEAALRLGIPAVGTMAHSWVQAFGDEPTAFAAFARHFPGRATLLVDTYNTLEGVRRAAAIEPPVPAVRLDSGDLAALAAGAREILDGAGRASTRIMASGDLDERRISELVARGAPIDAYGVGTELINSADAPTLGLVYKLVAIDGEGRIKLSEGKHTYPFAKQVYRHRDDSGRFECDVVEHEETSSSGEPLLVPVMTGGKVYEPLPSLEAIRARCREQVGSLPEQYRRLDVPALYPIRLGGRLKFETRAITERLGEPG